MNLFSSDMITQELQGNINFTCQDAKLRSLESVTVEHLALVLLNDSSVRKIMKGAPVDFQGLRRDLEDFLQTRVAQSESPPTPTTAFHRVINRATQWFKQSGKATGAHVLAAIFAESGSFAVYSMKKNGIERLSIIAHLASPAMQDGEEDAAADNDWVKLAVAGVLDAPFGRRAETDLLLRILARKYKNNPLLVGEPGVGKTAVVHALAHRIAAGEVPENLSELRLIAVSMADLVAGTKYRGDFEKRFRQLLARCRQDGATTLFIDEIHTVIGAGSVAGGALDAANILKPAIGNGEIRCIGATTFTEFRRLFEKDSALARRFQKIEINEPDGKELDEILSGVVGRLSKHHNVTYQSAATAAAVRVSRQYMPGRNLPDKAIDLLDDAGANRRLFGDYSAINEDDIIAAAAAYGFSGAATKDVEKRRLVGLREKLSTRVFGQEEAVDCLTGALLRARLGFRENDETVGSFLFAGPTGVGKTEMARQLAEVLKTPLVRYDMSEYLEAHTVSRLIGAPPGYVGFEQSGKLSEDIARHPAAVLLFDEIEKAHPDIFNIFLQIMDYGVLTDAQGRHADFKNAVLIMTSNAGAREMERGLVGFERNNGGGVENDAIKRIFSPEFRNRLDAVVHFAPLKSTGIIGHPKRPLVRFGNTPGRGKRITIDFWSALTSPLENRRF